MKPKMTELIHLTYRKHLICNKKWKISSYKENNCYKVFVAEFCEMASMMRNIPNVSGIEISTKAFTVRFSKKILILELDCVIKIVYLTFSQQFYEVF